MITVKEVKTRKEQKEFVNFPLDLYAGNPNFTPPLYMDEMKMFKKNYVYSDCCEFICFNAYKDGEMAGRIQGIIQIASNEKRNEKRARFSRFDVIDDKEVSAALFKAFEDWAVSKGMDTTCGPLNFSDLEREGLLIEGFDYNATFEELYNYPYYAEHIEALGYAKEVDWNSSRLYGPASEQDVEELEKLTDFIFKRYKLHYGESKSGADFIKRYKDGIFELLDKAYEGLYGTVPFTEGMKELMISNFKLVVSNKFAASILDENGKIVCFGFAIPSLRRALSLTRGKFTPKVLVNLLKCMRKPDVLDLCLVGVDPEYLNRGISASLSLAIMRMLRDNPEIKYAETNLNLLDNFPIQNQWKRFHREIHKIYRSYCKKLV